MLGLFLVSLSQTAMNVIGSTLGLMIINGMVFAGMAILAAKKRVEDLRYFCEWFVFCTQILFAYGSTTSPGISSVVKCAAQLCLLSSMLAYVTQANDIAITSTFIMALAVFASVTLAFMLHAISPYETALGLYAAVVYSLVWCVYTVDESFKRVLVREL
ncbi:hypothetical protein GGH13_007673 [Coemansia sp. S155-1]|nr:hypothetical protein GGH13_007673 [Coemansia sp. S155-1]